jgi:hypothetical protein
MSTRGSASISAILGDELLVANRIFAVRGDVGNGEGTGMHAAVGGVCDQQGGPEAADHGVEVMPRLGVHARLPNFKKR